MKIQHEVINGYKEIEVPFALIANEEETKKLAIFLPGAGYTNQRPLFHFSEGVFLNKGMDVLEIDYRYNEPSYAHFEMEELSEAVRFDVKTVIDEVLRENRYEEFYLIAKSLGTIALCTELQREEFKDAKVVWLTPLIHRDDVLTAMVTSKQKGLCFIGDSDRCYTEARYTQLLDNPNLSSKLLPDITHDMEYADDPIKSIDVLKEIMEEINLL